MLNFPNILTLARIIIIPLILICFLVEAQFGAIVTWACFGLYVIAAITDFIDGWWARKFNQISAFGTFLDPISDKIFVGCLLVLLAAYGRVEGLWLIPVLLIMTREFLVSGLREFLGPRDVQMPVTNLAKWKTASQMISLALLILAPLVTYAQITGLILLSISALLTVITGYGYLKTGWQYLTVDERK